MDKCPQCGSDPSIHSGVGYFACDTIRHEFGLTISEKCWRRQCEQLEAALAKATSEHPADDGEPITREWLESAGFWKPMQPCRSSYFHLSVDSRSVNVWEKGIPTGIFADMSVAKNTRGDVRRLCRCLGIELKDESDGKT